MTFCVGIRMKNDIVAISDTRLTSGDVDFVVSSKKVFFFEEEKHSMFIMLSGLKSISDMVITYLNERKEYLFNCTKLYQGVDFVAKVIREVRTREESWLENSSTEFDINYLIGGQFIEDDSPQLFRIYSEGSWKRISKDSPFEIIGEGRYGKYILEYAANIDNLPEKSLLLGLLAFDATQKSYPLCSPPLDVITYKKDSFKIKKKRLSAGQVQKLSDRWHTEVNKSVEKLLPLGKTLIK